MPDTRTEAIEALYTQYPYPSPAAGHSLLYDLANLFFLLCEGDDLAGRSILDAGCGTGQRVLGLARRYPAARFLGIDLAETSLRLAGQLAGRHGIRNAAFRRADILELELGETFDFIVSTGVLHHLADPARGLDRLCRHLAPDGVVCLWFYHPFGEWDRLVGRELLQALWGTDRAELAAGQRIMERLGLGLRPEQYGYAAGGTQAESEGVRLSADADAFMNPIVHAYRLDEAMAMFRACDVEWVAVNGINTAREMKLVDLAQVEGEARAFCLWDADLFQDEELRCRYRALPSADRLRVVETVARPMGFTVMAGRGDSLGRLGPRLAGNAIPRAELPAPYPRVLRV